MKMTIVLNVSEPDNNFIDILKPGYNIIDETIYDDELTRQILELIQNARRESAY